MTLTVSKVLRLIAEEPPQQKFFFPSAPNAEAIAAFQTERSCEEKPPRTGTNQRYPVVAPIVSSLRGAIKARNQKGCGRASVSTKTNTSVVGSACWTAILRLLTF